MTSPDALASIAFLAAINRWRGSGTADGVDPSVGWTALPSTRSTNARTPTPRSFPHRLNAWTGNPSTPRSMLAALLFVPLVSMAQQTDTTAAPATAASMAGASTEPAPAAQEPASAPRRPGETTTGRPPAPTQPAPSTTPAAAVPPTAPLPGDAAGVTTPPAPSTTTTAPNPTAGDTPRVALPPSASAGPGTAGGILQTILALALVLGLLAGMAWILKRYGPRQGGGSANLRVVGALNLGGRERIMVVEVGDQWIVVGAAPGRVNALHTMPRQEGELAPVAAHGGIPATTFSDWLKKTIDKRNAT